MTVRARLLWTIALIGLLLTAPAGYGIRQLSELRDIAAELRGRHAEAFHALGQLQAALAEFDRYQRSYLAVPTSELHGRALAALATARREVSRLDETGYGDVVHDVETGIAALHASATRIDSLIRAGEVDEATAYFEEVKPLVGRVLDSLGPVARAIDETSRSAAEQAQRISRTATTVAIGALIVTSAIAIVLAVTATGLLTRPLRRLRAATGAVAGGEFVAPPDLPYDRRDEIGDLSRSFRAMTHRLAELDRLKGEFISIVSHEFKTPINVITGYAELLEDGLYGAVNEEQREVLAAIREQAHDLANLSSHLLALGRVEAGNFPVRLVPTELRPLLDELERAFRALAVRQGIDFAIEVAPAVPATIVADPQRLRQEVLGNLLSNAFKFTPEGGRIRVVVSADDSLRISVSDTGVGISAELLPKIFEKYYQVRHDGGAAGAGLGLAIAREVVEAHGGRIEASSTPGQGTTMSIELPLATAGG